MIEPVPSMVELWQAEDAELMLPTQTYSDQHTGEHLQEQHIGRPSGRALHLQPSVLDFGAQSVGLPKVQSFCAFNPSRDTDIEVNSVFTSGRNFHVSPVHSMVIPARGKSSFTVVFLPDEEGNFESSLFINTSSHGVMSYQVFGLGTFSAASKDSKKSFQRTDVLFPRIANIHLSQAQAEAINSSVWQVRLKCSIPFKQRQPCRSCFLSGHSLLLQVYFAVRLDGSQHDLETLRKYILENIFMIFVTSERNEDIDNSMIMYVLNSGIGLVHMQDIHHFLGDNLFVRFDPVMLLSSSINFTKAATIVCSALRESGCDSSAEKQLRVLEAAPPPSLCVSYNITEGYLNFDTSKISFYIQQLQDPSGLWSLWLENNLNFPVILTDVFVPEQVRGLFKILNFTHLLPVSPGCWDIFSLKIDAKEFPLNFLTNLMISTSLGVTFEIPLLVHKVESESENQQISTAQCGIHPIIRHLTSEESLRWQHGLSLGMSTWKIDYELGTELYEKYQKIQDKESCRRKNSENPSITQKKDVEQPLVFLPQLNAEPGLVVTFTATALSNNSVKNIVLKNPSPFPVWVQLLPLSYYPNPQAVLSLLSKWYGVNEQIVDFTTDEFKLQKECDQELEHIDCSHEVIELQLQPWERQQVGIVFTPVDYRKVTSLIVIRNNLTVLDVVTIEGVGAREMLRVGGRLPGIGGSLRFKVPESTLIDCRQQLRESKQVLSITKIFKVENIGSLPITIVSMKINGYSCQGFGFEVLDCYTFSLSQNTSKEISIVFIPDFTSSWVIRELTLVSASKLEFRFTLNVTLPHHLLPLCADGVPGPSWEESFWKLTVLFVSLSLFGVVLIAIQQAQYILTDFLKLRPRNCSSSPCQQTSNPVDTLTSESYRGSCKSFTDSSNPPDKGKGKGYLAVAAPPLRSQNASKRGPATYSHSQKKHKCSVYYSIKPKPSSASSNAPACDPNQQLIADAQPPSPKDSTCSETLAERWTDFNSVDHIDTGNQRHLTNPDDVLGAKESALQATFLSQRTINESTLKEEPIICMFPMETDFKTSSDKLSESKQQNCCGSSKIPEDGISSNLLQQQTESQPVFRKVEGNKLRASPTAVKGNIDASKKTVDKDVSAEKSTPYIPREEKPCGRVDLASAKHEEPFRKRSPVEKRDGFFPNLNWNKNRTCARKNKKKNTVFPARFTEQNALKHSYQEADRSELRALSRGKMWSSLTNGDVCRGEQKSSRVPPRGDTECYQILKKKSVERFSSDSSSECGSSRGSVRASRGSWGSWSSTSSSDGDKKNTLPNRLYFPPREAPTQNQHQNPISLNLSHSICNTSSDINALPHYPDILSSPPFPEADKNKGLYQQEDVWSAQPVCLTNDLNYNLEGQVPCVTQDPPSVQNSYINWNSTCDGPFSGIYGSLELNDFSSYPEENMNFHSSFPCPDVQNPAFIDQCQSTWNLNPPAPPPAPPPPGPPMPNSWEPTSYVSNSPYLSSTRSLSPMSGLFGSIWAPQNDVFDGYCPVSGSPPHSEHVGTHSMLCKQEYSSRFNPFHAYMNLDIWTTANRNQSFPVSRDSGYCGNM